VAAKQKTVVGDLVTAILFSWMILGVMDETGLLIVFPLLGGLLVWSLAKKA
jgi:hypothetical protein